MNSLKEEANEYEEEEDRIRVYLNVKPSKASDKLFYNISKDKKSISLLDNISLDNQKKWKKIEVDQIFTYKDENAYIYEEVMLNCIKNSLDGENFTFISYGDSDSEKHQLIIGTPDSYENINNRGLFPRLLENYINKIDSNEILSDTISLNLSYFLINNNNIIDLAQFMGRETKTLEKISREELLRKYSKEIKIDDHNNNYLKSIKKAPVETSNDSLFFLLQILNLFYKYEEPSNHFLNWSYFNIILYVTDNNGKTVSTISFIILPGNEILNQKIQKRRTVVLSNKKDNLLKNISKEFNNTIEDIIEQLDYKSINDQNKEKNKDNNNLTVSNKSLKLDKNKKGEVKSRLFNIIGNLSFDINNKIAQADRRYIIIGSMSGNSGHIQHTKETLSFLFKCKKFSGQKISTNKHHKFDSAFFDEKLKAKDNQIYDLESKLKSQESKLNQLNSLMDGKEANLKALQENYKEQIKSLKGEFGFEGDINNLLKENVNSDEYKYTLKIRSTTENNRVKNLKIEELKKQIIEIEKGIKQLRTLLDMKENDATMLDIIRSVREAKEKKRADMEVKNLVGSHLEDLEKKNKILRSKIMGYKNEISLKKNILNGLPDIFISDINVKKNMNNLKIKLGDNDNSMKWFINNKKEEMKKIKAESFKEKNIVISKYRNFINQTAEEIKCNGDKLSNVTTEYQKEKEGYLNELVQLYKFIIIIINYYRKAYLSNCSIFANKEKFDRILSKEEKNINILNFPLLYAELGKIGFEHFQLNNKKNMSKKRVIKSKYYKNIVEDDDDTKKEKEKEKENKNEKKIDFSKKSQRDKRLHKIINIIKLENSNESIDKTIEPVKKEVINEKIKLFSQILRKTDSQLTNMTKEELMQYCKISNEKIIEVEKFIKNNFEDKENFNSFDPVKEREDEIKKKIKYINKKIFELTNKYNNNNVIFENGDKIIQKLRNENHLLRKSLYDHDGRNLYYSLYPTFVNSKPKKINLNSFNKTKKYTNNNTNNNYYNSVLTTTSSNFNQIFHNSTRGDNFGNDTNDNIQLNLTENYSNYATQYFKKRPISSINKINSYFMVGENL